MRTRIAIGLLLALSLTAILPVTAGAQISDSGSAAQVQYPDVTPTPPPPTPVQTAQAPPAESGLPVTGFVVLPLLLTGALLLVTGGVMHVRTRREE